MVKGIKKKVGIIFTPEYPIRISLKNDSAEGVFNFSGGTKEPNIISLPYNKKSHKEVLRSIRINKRIPKMIIKKINKNSIIVEILDNCYRMIYYNINQDQNDKGKEFRISLMMHKNKHLNFID